MVTERLSIHRGRGDDLLIFRIEMSGEKGTILYQAAECDVCRKPVVIDAQCDLSTTGFVTQRQSGLWHFLDLMRRENCEQDSVIDENFERLFVDCSLRKPHPFRLPRKSAAKVVDSPANLSHLVAI